MARFQSESGITENRLLALQNVSVWARQGEEWTMEGEPTGTSSQLYQCDGRYTKADKVVKVQVAECGGAKAAKGGI